MTATTGPDTVEVVLRGLPVALYAAGKERNDELMREFAHIANSDASTSSSIPGRLVEVVEQVRAKYGAFSDATTQEILDAHDRGQAHIDAVYHVPAHLAPQLVTVTEEVGALWDEADEYCRSGDLLALEPPPDVLRLRHWFLSEFRRQLVDGRPPQPFDEYDG